MSVKCPDFFSETEAQYRLLMRKYCVLWALNTYWNGDNL